MSDLIDPFDLSDSSDYPAAMKRDADRIAELEARAAQPVENPIESTVEFALMEAQAEATELLSIIKQGVMCEAEDKMIPLSIEDESDPSVGIFGARYLVLPDGYDVVPTAPPRPDASGLIEAAEVAESWTWDRPEGAEWGLMSDAERSAFYERQRTAEAVSKAIGKALRSRAADRCAPRSDTGGA